MDAFAKIPVVSKRQAMDWSLVLLSQGIEPRIDSTPDEAVWWIEVSEAEELRSLDAIRKYVAENRRWIWRRPLAFEGLLFDWAALSWVVLITVFFWASSEAPVLRDAGVMDTSALHRGEWWRLCTAVWLHADPGHLASNASMGILLLGLTLGLYGTGTGMLAAFLAGIGGNLLAWIVTTTPHQSLGASGLVMGCIGLLAAHTLIVQGPNKWKLLITSFAAALMLFVLLGLSPGTDVAAHAGGAISGFVIGSVLALIGIRAESPRLNLVCGGLFFLVTVVPWVLAVRGEIS